MIGALMSTLRFPRHVVIWSLSFTGHIIPPVQIVCQPFFFNVLTAVVNFSGAASMLFFPFPVMSFHILTHDYRENFFKLET